jgi:nicotinamidase/pyrazinamidase
VADLELPSSVIKITNGFRFDQDQYSSFDQTGLGMDLKHKDITQLWIGRLTEDVSNRATVLDAVREGYEVTLAANATLTVARQSGEAAR